MIENPLEKNIKTCVIFFGLGGPSSVDKVEKFLFNLFFDKRIICLPKPFRFIIAKLISTLRKNKSSNIYRSIGGYSPIIENTQSQAIALQNNLKMHYGKTSEDVSINWRVFYAMRHSEPFLTDIIKDIEDFDPQNIILLPTYPQYSTTTTESFFDAWEDINIQLNADIIKVYDYHDNEMYIKACKNAIIEHIKSEKIDINNTRFLFSAHGLPESIIKKGDSYQKQTERSFMLIFDAINKELDAHIDAKLCYQSKVGPKKWLAPSLNTEVELCAKDAKNVAIFPISFTSEHSETLYELDIEYKEIAESLGIKKYYRIQTLSTNSDYISCLGKIVRDLV